MARFAAIDCGTNSLRLLICEYKNGVTKEILRLMEIVRLGQGVDATGELDPAAIERTREVLKKYVELMRQERVTDVRMVATSATRDASNKDEFFRMTAQLLGTIRPGAVAEVITGEEEATLSFIGAVADLADEPGPYCVIDLGGGSTEFVVGNADGEILGSHSAQMGCVRMTERIMRSDPPTDIELEIARDHVAERIEQTQLIVPIAQAKTFVGCAGTFTTIAALALGLEEYDPKAIHDSQLRFDALRVLTNQLIGITSAERRMNPVVHPGRADVIAGGAVVVQGILDMIENQTGITSMVISEKDILDGIIADLVADSEAAAAIRAAAITGEVM
ncbi:Ppx/GppA phosphatase family [Corynebacterium mustelae]|uniref:Ppx/GppA phosphatase family n=1 Tax=Corynebacterium mustelae TaxID=571915 RepID=A0A0G3H0T2_9CORY|nr:Ppx/GppA phosphatase family protein [Corynebacterium mustelae]AKK05433.1 Ppx/GppA phosphatase family [Corynebacterium mustelae]